MKRVVANFLQHYADLSKPMLLGLSGGPDSLLLFHLLLELKQIWPIQLAVAHIDHGWRDCSSQEAAQLQAYVTNFGLGFHLKALEPLLLKGNLEAACREKRLQFFRQLCQTHGYQAVLLGHHADDQAETVLKKIFECSQMNQLVGLQPRVDEDGLTLWRPLLTIRKSEILKQVENHALNPFDDATNRDLRFLRSRMRQEIIPSLSKAFGKEIAPSLARLSREAMALQKYLDGKVAHYLERIAAGPFGTMLDLLELQPMAEVELKHLLRLFLLRCSLALPYPLLETAVQFLTSQAANKELHYDRQRIVIDRCRIFVMSERLASATTTNELLQLTEGNHLYGNWQIEVRSLSGSKACTVTDWHSAWQGYFETVLPAGNYCLAYPQLSCVHLGTSSLRKWWQNHRVPACLREIIPVITCDNRVAQELLTGKSKAEATGIKTFVIKGVYESTKVVCKLPIAS